DGGECTIKYNEAEHDINLIALMTTGESLKSSQSKWLVTIGSIIIGLAVALLVVAGILALIPTGGTSALAVVAGLVGLHALGLSTLSSAIAAGTTLSVGASATLAAATASVGSAAVMGGVGGLTLFAGRDSNLQKAVKEIQMKPPVLEDEAKEVEKTTIEKMLSSIYSLFQPTATLPEEGLPVAIPVEEEKPTKK
ncbi:hypothetical protein N9Q05_02785, partial [bacterium]|nr:hypothetical protein [bacterium]